MRVIAGSSGGGACRCKKQVLSEDYDRIEERSDCVGSGAALLRCGSLVLIADHAHKRLRVLTARQSEFQWRSLETKWANTPSRGRPVFDGVVQLPGPRWLASSDVPDYGRTSPLLCGDDAHVWAVALYSASAAVSEVISSSRQVQLSNGSMRHVNSACVLSGGRVLLSDTQELLLLSLEQLTPTRVATLVRCGERPRADTFAAATVRAPRSLVAHGDAAFFFDSGSIFALRFHTTDSLTPLLVAHFPRALAQVIAEFVDDGLEGAQFACLRSVR